MLFQNSCVVPLGITAMVSFFFELCVPDRWQATAKIAADMTRKAMIGRISVLFLLFSESAKPAWTQRNLLSLVSLQRVVERMSGGYHPWLVRQRDGHNADPFIIRQDERAGA